MSLIIGFQMADTLRKCPKTQGAPPTAWRLLAALVAGALLLCLPPAGQAETIVGELALSHASFLVSAARFTHWPADVFRDDKSPLVFCVYRDPVTGMALQERLQGEQIRGRSLRKVDIDTFEQLSQCHVVYLPAARIEEFPRDERGLHGVLSVSDCREFAEAEGTLGFIRGENGVDVIINIEALNTSDMSISPSLLQMAELVKMHTAASRTGKKDK